MMRYVINAVPYKMCSSSTDFAFLSNDLPRVVMNVDPYNSYATF